MTGTVAQKRIMVLMPVWQVSFEDRYTRLLGVLRERGYAVDFCVLTDEMTRRRQIHLPGVPESRLHQGPIATLAPRPVRSLMELFFAGCRADAVIMGSGKGLDKVSAVLAAVGLPRVEMNDVGDIFMYAYRPDAVAINGEMFRRNFLECGGEVEPERVHVTGDIRFDAVNAEVPTEHKTIFFQKYGLPPDRPFVVFCSGAIQRIDPWTADLYKKIVATVQASPLSLVIRLHPNDVAGHKRETTLGDVSSRVLYPDVPALEPQDWQTAMKLGAAAISVDSTTFLEPSVFGKYAIVVNIHEWCLLPEHRDKDVFPRRRFTGFGRCGRWKDPATGEVMDSPYLWREGGAYGTRALTFPGYDWVGADCHVDELAEVLAHPGLLKPDPDLCREHAQRYWFRQDGRTAERVADLLPDILNSRKGSWRRWLSWPGLMRPRPPVPDRSDDRPVKSGRGNPRPNL